MPHTSRVQSAVFFKLTAYPVSLGGFSISECNPKELTAGGVAIPNGEILVAPVREGWKDGLHGGAAVLSGVVVTEGSKWLQQVDEPWLEARDPRLKRRQRTGALLQNSLFESRVVSNQRSLLGNRLAQTSHKLWAWVARTPVPLGQ